MSPLSSAAASRSESAPSSVASRGRPYRADPGLLPRRIGRSAGMPGPMTVITHGGDVLRVWRDADQQYWLEGPSRAVYSGTWPLTAKNPVRPVEVVRAAKKG